MKDNKMFWIIKFDELVDSFDENDEICVEDAQVEMRKNWQHYIDAGCDTGEIVKMMSPLDIFENYDDMCLKNIDISEKNLIRKIEASLHGEPKKLEEFFKENYSWFLENELLEVALPLFIVDCYNRKEFIYDHIDEVENQVDQSTLSEIVLDCYARDGMMLDGDMFEEYRNAGLNISLLAEYAFKHGFNNGRITDEQWIEIIDCFSDAGVPRKSIAQLLESFSGWFYSEILFENDQIYWLKQYDDNLAPYIDKIFEYGCLDDLNFRDKVHLISELPKEVQELASMKLFRDGISIHDLDIEICELGTVEDFLEESGMEIDFLVDKFLEEDGYANCCDDWLALQLFELAPTKLDSKKVVQMVLDDDEDPEDLEKIYNKLKELGVDEEVLAPLLETN